MALLKAVGYMVAILVIYYSLENQGYGQILSVIFKERMGTKASHMHAIEKRVAPSNSSDYVIEAVISTSDLEQLRTILSALNFPFMFNNTEILSVDTTTVCTSDVFGYQCRCEQSFAWSYGDCITHGTCDSIIGGTCGCINALPAIDQQCQPNTSQTEPTPSPTPPNDTLVIDLVLDLRIPFVIVTPDTINQLKGALAGFPFPHHITESLKVLDAELTTVCYPILNGQLQCQCEDQFSWPCDKCNEYSACNNDTGQPCGCINGLPSDGQFCEPTTNISQCPTPTPITTVTTEMTTETTEMTTVTTEMTTEMTTETTEMTTVTTEMTTETTEMTTETTEMTTETTKMKTETTLPPPPPTKEEKNLSFTMKLVYDDSYNNPASDVYQTTNNTIQEQSRAHISNLDTAKIIAFRRGSTIADYTITATSFQEGEIEAVKSGIFTQLAKVYPMIYDSPTALNFEPPEVFFGKSVTVTCGPPPEHLNFSSNLKVEWRRDNILVLEDSEHSFSTQNGAATLTISNFFSTDNGQYECRLEDDSLALKLVFRQKSSEQFILKKTPLIQVIPVRQKVGCTVGKEVRLQCSVDSPYEVEFKDIPTAGQGATITHQFSIPDCESLGETFTCQEKTYQQFSKEITLELSTDNFVCVNDPVFGDGMVDDKAVGPCESDKVGEKIAVCRENAEWEVQQDNCILRVVQELLSQSENLNNNSLPLFLDQLSNVTSNFTDKVVESPATINAIVEILNNVANTSSLLIIPITKTSMEDVLLVTDVLTTDEAKQSWDFLNSNDTENILVTRRNFPNAESASSTLLLSLETLTSSLTNESFDIVTPSILLNKTTFTDTFEGDFNSSVEVDIPESDGEKKSITVITFASMDNVLPARDEGNSSFFVINGRVALVRSSGDINNVSFTFDVINDTLGNPQCVFWNFSLFDGLGGWDNEGCELVSNVNETVTCFCNHLTSFSILMSPYSPDDPLLDIMTYIGVGISMASLVICLIIEAVIWRKIRKNNTSYLRHVCIVNIAVSLLIANIWFIIGAAISDAEEENQPACSAATFFIHFFYLALFFWMLASALLLLYRTVSVFDGGLSKKSMLAIGFCLGYGAPLIIAIITIAVTAPRQEYIRGTGICWLNWDESKALLAFVIPALLIVAINILILLVVIYKMLRRRAVGDTAQAAERHVLVVITRTLLVLTPIFGITWGLGIGIMISPYNRDVHISFAFFNSLQGFFILLFGTLLDRKVRSELAIQSHTSRSGTGSTSGGNSSSGVLGFLRNRRRGRDGYNISSSGASYSFTNT